MFSIQQISPSSAGTLAVAVVAFFFCVFQIGVALKRPEYNWNAWGGVLSFAVGTYALAVFVQFNAGIGWANHTAELIQYSSFLLLIHALYGFTLPYLALPSKQYHRLAGSLHIVLLGLLWTTDLVIRETFIFREFYWLAYPYIEPQIGPLGAPYLAYCVGAAAWGLRHWIRHRQEMKSAKYISGAGCNATATILPLYPLFKQDVVDTAMPVVAEAKCGSSEGGNSASEASHHPERSGCVRSYRPTGHRHIAEMEQELGNLIHFSATSIEMVRGILLTAHLFVRPGTTEKDIWQTYRAVYGREPFIRIVKEKQGIYRYPEPKILAGTNYCDIGFELSGTRLVVIAAIDNLMKGAAGQAVHAMNVMCGFEETAALEFAGLHPV